MQESQNHVSLETRVLQQCKAWMTRERSLEISSPPVSLSLAMFSIYIQIGSSSPTTKSQPNKTTPYISAPQHSNKKWFKEKPRHTAFQREASAACLATMPTLQKAKKDITELLSFLPLLSYTLDTYWAIFLHRWNTKPHASWASVDMKNNITLWRRKYAVLKTKSEVCGL